MTLLLTIRQVSDKKEGDWIGVDLRDIRDVTEISILQGRNSVDDVDYFDHAIWNVLLTAKHGLPLSKN